MALRDHLSQAVLDYHNRKRGDERTLVDILEEAVEDYIYDNNVYCLACPECDG